VADLQSAPTPTQVPISLKSCDDSAQGLAFCLALFAKTSPDLAFIVERWDSLPEAIRAGITVMVRAAAPK
jgi:hypothetical protein